MYLSTTQLEKYEQRLSEQLPEDYDDDPEAARLYLLVDETHRKEQQAYHEYVDAMIQIRNDRCALLDQLTDWLDK